MGQSLSKIIVHIVFSTKNRETTIHPYKQQQLFAYMAGICRKKGSEPFSVGGVSDHVHIACTLPRTKTVAKLVEEIKVGSSVWMKEGEHAVPHFHWQDGYGIFSVSESHLPKLIRYIENQEEHHRSEKYEAEIRNICDHYNVEFDERYMLG